MDTIRVFFPKLGHLFRFSKKTREGLTPSPLPSCVLAFTGQLRWLLLAFRCSKYFVSAESGIYCWQSHWLLSRLPWKHVEQPLELFCKKGVLGDFGNLTGKHLCWSLFLLELQTWPLGLQLYLKETPKQMFSCGIDIIFKNT